MKVKEIIENYLKENGYSGLCYPEEDCGCQLEDLYPCSSDCPLDCQPGYKVQVDPETIGFGVNWKIVPEKTEGK